MREFQDEKGTVWVASVHRKDGDDYKGRYFLKVAPKGDEAEGGFLLEDVRWNSPKTAERTLQTMAELELRRRLRIAAGRQRTQVPA